MAARDVGKTIGAVAIAGLLAALALPSIVQAVYPTSTNGRIAFVRCDPNQCDIWLMNPDGSAQVDLTNTPAPLDEFDPEFSPDGKRIVFRRDDPAQRDLFIMNADGSGQINLTHTPAS